MNQLSPHIPAFAIDGYEPRQQYIRGLDAKVGEGRSNPMSIGLLNVDTAILKFMQEKIRPTVMQDGKSIRVPVIYASPERWKSVQNDGYLRERNGKILLPLIMIRRSGMEKNTINSPVNKYQTYTYQTRWNSRNVYDRFTVQNKVKPSREYHTIAIPDHYELTYEGTIWTEFIEQMNPLVETISFESDEYWGDSENGYRFIARIASFEQQEELPTRGDRLVRSKFTIKVRAYILPEFQLDTAGNRAKTTQLRYSPKKFVFDELIIDRTGRIIRPETPVRSTTIRAIQGGSFSLSYNQEAGTTVIVQITNSQGEPIVGQLVEISSNGTLYPV